MFLWLTLNGLFLLVAYLLGSLPSGYWAGRLVKGFDIREQGSGSTGATNVLRTVGQLPALIVLLVDILKGSAAIALFHWLYASELVQPWVPNTVDPAVWLPWMVTLAGMLALLGHSKSLFLNFTGGKSVATSLGVLLALNWIVGLGTLAVFLAVLGITRIVSISSIMGAIATSGLMVATNQPVPYLLFSIAGGIYVIWRHRTNIQRLMAGTEPQLGQTLPEVTTPPQF
ncbi:glycerol-3-phosphate 1-O-acyltransferase PlsY [Leptolyngbyaceae cyanobacterium UHCC 1019]